MSRTWESFGSQLGCHPLGEKNSEDPETARKTEARWVTQKEESANADWSNGEAVTKPKQVVLSSQVFDDPEKYGQLETQVPAPIDCGHGPWLKTWEEVSNTNCHL